MILQHSKKETALNEKLLSLLTGRTRQLAELLVNDEEIGTLQNYANTVSIKRLGFNDHGPVHMRQAAINGMKLAHLLKEAGISMSLEKEEAGSYEDSLCAILLASFLHDSGMTMTRSLHEQTALIFAYPIITRLLEQVYADDNQKFIVRSLALEGILGHMASININSLEAGVILLADGCDMQKGRARIPLIASSGHEGKTGDIHKYSADAIEKVSIKQGEQKPVRIEVNMSSSIGFFQVEEVLMPKINKSPVKPYIELIALLENDDYKQYL
jgi:metal-dependent HD superfamily phosphatase/phosphodiesterase